MPAHAPGARHRVASAPRRVVHGALCTADGFVGAAFKILQPSRWVQPGVATGQAQSIEVGEAFEILLEGLHETPAAGNLSAAAVGNDVYINSANDTLGVAAQGLTTGNLNAGWLPVGKVERVEVRGATTVLVINQNVAYLCKVGTGG